MPTDDTKTIDEAEGGIVEEIDDPEVEETFEDEYVAEEDEMDEDDEFFDDDDEEWEEDEDWDEEEEWDEDWDEDDEDWDEDDEWEYDDDEEEDENPLAYKKVQRTTDDLNSIARDGVAVARELKEAYDDIKQLMDFKSLFKF